MKHTDQVLKEQMKKMRISARDSKLRAAQSAAQIAFEFHEQERRICYFEFLYQQSHFIRKRIWLFQSALLVVLWFVLQYADTGLYIQCSIGSAAPVFAMLIIPEIWKNETSNSVEVECASFYTLRQIYTARLQILAGVDFLILTVFYLITTKNTALNTEQFMINFLLPLVIACCICFRCLYSSRIQSEYLAMLLCMGWDVIWIMIIQDQRLYQHIAYPVWIGVLFVSVLYLLYTVYRLQNKQYSWEVNALWD